MKLDVRVELPGAAARTWSVAPGERARVRADASSVAPRRIAAWSAGGVLVLGALGALAVAVVVTRRG